MRTYMLYCITCVQQVCMPLCINSWVQGEQHQLWSLPVNTIHLFSNLLSNPLSFDLSVTRGRQHFVTFIDEYSRKLWAFVLKSKDQVQSFFREFQARGEREPGQKLKVVWTNNGGEYRGQLKEYYKAQGIRIEYTVPNTPELNGLAKRINRGIMERVRSMLCRMQSCQNHIGLRRCTQLYI